MRCIDCIECCIACGIACGVCVCVCVCVCVSNGGIGTALERQLSDEAVCVGGVVVYRWYIRGMCIDKVLV
jgi:hypothetical protein